MQSTKHSRLQEWIHHESFGGICLMASAALALIFANSPLSGIYNYLLETPVVMGIGNFILNKPLILWVNDGLMAIFFLLVGLELKREFLSGNLSNIKTISLPILGAIGGMAVPALIYVYFTHDQSSFLRGWAIPAATDIAFALGILSLLGSRVPTGLKTFLSLLAIFDDIGAIIIIALFYTSHISVTALMIAAICIGILFLFNRLGITDSSPYIFVGVIMWIALLKSGVHATLAGIILAMFIPLKRPVSKNGPVSGSLELSLHSLVVMIILPIFAFCNSGIPLIGVGLDNLLHPVPLGIAAGLFIGKQLGIFGICWVAIKLGFAKLPAGVNMTSLYGTAILCGIGFTMSLFIGSLAFEETGINRLFDERLGILLGSLASGILGYIILNKSLKSIDPV
jgi:NhaA family Na+:H+ antiporter